MSTDPPRPVEDRLRRALGEGAAAITPTDRLDAILREAHAAAAPGSGSSSGRRWLVPAAAAAAAVLVAATVWTVNRPPTAAPTVPVASTVVSRPTPTSATAETSTEVATPTPTASSLLGSGAPVTTPAQTAPPTAPPTPPPPTSTVTTSPVPPPAAMVTLPVYYLGPVVAGSTEVRLFREFVSAPTQPGDNGLAALRLAMGPAPSGSSYRAAWTGVTAVSVSVGSTVITVRLSSGTRDSSPLATEQLVWTVQAAVGTLLPVRFELADGGATVSPGHPVSSTYTRPTSQAAVLDQLAPIWVDEPARGAVVRAGRALQVQGIASTFEGAVEWELLRDGARLDSGSTTASAGAPARGTYHFTTTTPLPSGSYVLRVFATSAADGSAVAEQRVPVTAR